MINLESAKAQIAAGALHAEIEALIGSKFLGVSHNGITVTVHLTDEATSGEQAQATGAVEDHSPVILSYTRAGDTVMVMAWLPYDDAAANVTVEADGIALPSPTTLSVDPRGGKSGSEEIVDDEAFVVTVVGYAHTSMNVEAM